MNVDGSEVRGPGPSVREDGSQTSGRARGVDLQDLVGVALGHA